MLLYPSPYSCRKLHQLDCCCHSTGCGFLKYSLTESLWLLPKPQQYSFMSLPFMFGLKLEDLCLLSNTYFRGCFWVTKTSTIQFPFYFGLPGFYQRWRWCFFCYGNRRLELYFILSSSERLFPIIFSLLQKKKKYWVYKKCFLRLLCVSVEVRRTTWGERMEFYWPPLQFFPVSVYTFSDEDKMVQGIIDRKQNQW